MHELETQIEGFSRDKEETMKQEQLWLDWKDLEQFEDRNEDLDSAEDLDLTVYQMMIIKD